MYLGKLMESRPADELYDKPIHPYTSALLVGDPDPRPGARTARASGCSSAASRRTRSTRRRLPFPHPLPARDRASAASSEPPLTAYAGGHLAACHHPQNVTRSGARLGHAARTRAPLARVPKPPSPRPHSQPIATAPRKDSAQVRRAHSKAANSRCQTVGAQVNSDCSGKAHHERTQPCTPISPGPLPIERDTETSSVRPSSDGSDRRPRTTRPAQRRLSDTSSHTRAGHISELVGRLGELGQLELAAREAAGGIPALVLLSGESGVGKTRLIGVRAAADGSARGARRGRRAGAKPSFPMRR